MFEFKFICLLLLELFLFEFSVLEYLEDWIGCFGRVEVEIVGLLGDVFNGIFVDGGLIWSFGVLGWNVLDGEFLIKFFILFVIWVICLLVVVFNIDIFVGLGVVLCGIELFKVLSFCLIFFFVDSCFIGGLCLSLFLLIEVMELYCFGVKKCFVVRFCFLWLGVVVYLKFVLGFIGFWLVLFCGMIIGLSGFVVLGDEIEWFKILVECIGFWILLGSDLFNEGGFLWVGVDFIFLVFVRFFKFGSDIDFLVKWGGFFEIFVRLVGMVDLWWNFLLIVVWFLEIFVVLGFLWLIEILWDFLFVIWRLLGVNFELFVILEENLWVFFFVGCIFFNFGILCYFIFFLDSEFVLWVVEE